MLDQPVVGIDGAFYFADGKEIGFLVLPDGTVRQLSGDVGLSEFERPRLAATMPILKGLRDALLDSGLADVEEGPLRVVPLPESADVLAWHLLNDHRLNADSILNWLLIRSESAHSRGEVIYPDNSVAVFLEQLHLSEHDYADKEFDHAHEGDSP